MKNSKPLVSMFLMIALLSIGVSAKVQGPSARINIRQVSNILQRLARSSDRFRKSLSIAVERSRADGRPENDINSFDRDFESATNRLNGRFKLRRANAADVRNVLQKASPINDFISRRRFDERAQNDWTSVQSNLEALARAFSVDWEWNPQTLPPVSTSRSYRLSERELEQLIQRIEAGANAFRSSLTDAFDQTRYDRTRSEGKMNEAVASFKRASDQLRNHFDARESIAGDVQHLIVQATPVDAYMRNNKLTDRAQNDWSALRGDLEGLASAYNTVPRWNVSNGSQPVLTNTTANGDFILRDGESVVAVLDTDLSTKLAKQGDRFALTVRQPTQYAGAVIAGTIADIERGGSLSGRSQMSLNFETLRLRNGQTYRFAGVIDSVRTENGETVQVENEGAIREDTSQTTRTIQRAGIGTAIGAIIGAVAGGGKGAVIGGVIGAAGGAGSVYVQGKDDLELPMGTEVTIRASAPK